MLSWEGSCAVSSSDGFKLVSYNILSELYAESAKHDYCPLHLRVWEYRLPKILGVVLESDADVVCLQEVTTRAFREEVKPALEQHGYRGYLSRDLLGTKRPQGRHFLAVFARGSVFTPKEVRCFCLRDHAVHGWTEKKIGKKLRALNNSVMVCRLQHRSGREVVIANIHVFFDPEHVQVKTSQVHIATWLIHSFNDTEPRAPVIFCGDFNSMPIIDRTRMDHVRFPTTDERSGTFTLLLDGKLESGHPEHPCHYGRSSSTFRDLRVVPALRNRYRPLTDVYCDAKSDTVTTQTDTFKGRIDHIFFEQSSGLVRVKWLKLPTASALGAIPNEKYPSDHVPVGAAFELVDVQQEAQTEDNNVEYLLWIALLLLVVLVLSSPWTVPNDILSEN